VNAICDYEIVWLDSFFFNQVDLNAVWEAEIFHYASSLAVIT
jgi:hypothetical protein